MHASPRFAKRVSPLRFVAGGGLRRRSRTTDGGRRPNADRRRRCSIPGRQGLAARAARRRQPHRGRRRRPRSALTASTARGRSTSASRAAASSTGPPPKRRSPRSRPGPTSTPCGCRSTSRAGWAINGAPAALLGRPLQDGHPELRRSWLHKHDLIPILELHWVGPGTTLANRQQPMPDADHAPAFWTDVATTFLDDDGVVLEPYNEPFPDGNKDSDAGVGVLARRLHDEPVPAGGQHAHRHVPGGGHAVDRRRDPRRRLDARHPAGRRAVLERAHAVAGVRAERSARATWARPGTSTTSTPASSATAGTPPRRRSRPRCRWWRRRSARTTAWAASSRRSCSGSTATAPATSPGRGTRSARACRRRCRAEAGSPGRSSPTTRRGTPNGGYAQAFHDHVAGR